MYKDKLCKHLRIVEQGGEQLPLVLNVIVITAAELNLNVLERKNGPL